MNADYLASLILCAALGGISYACGWMGIQIKRWICLVLWPVVPVATNATSKGFSEMSTIRKRLIAAGVKNLKEFGYPDCNETNILTDRIFSAFFVSMLEQNRGHDRRIDEAIASLMRDVAMDSATSKG